MLAFLALIAWLALPALLVPMACLSHEPGARGGRLDESNKKKEKETERESEKENTKRERETKRGRARQRRKDTE